MRGSLGMVESACSVSIVIGLTFFAVLTSAINTHADREMWRVVVGRIYALYAMQWHLYTACDAV